MDPPHAISRLARLAQPLPLWRFAPAFPHLVVLMVDAGTPPELPPGLREQYLAGMRSQLGLLATIADRLTAAGNDREALAMLQRETHKIHGSAGSYGFPGAPPPGLGRGGGAVSGPAPHGPGGRPPPPRPHPPPRAPPPGRPPPSPIGGAASPAAARPQPWPAAVSWAASETRRAFGRPGAGEAVGSGRPAPTASARAAHHLAGTPDRASHTGRSARLPAPGQGIARRHPPAARGAHQRASSSSQGPCAPGSDRGAGARAAPVPGPGPPARRADAGRRFGRRAHGRARAHRARGRRLSRGAPRLRAAGPRLSLPGVSQRPRRAARADRPRRASHTSPSPTRCRSPRSRRLLGARRPPARASRDIPCRLHHRAWDGGGDDTVCPGTRALEGVEHRVTVETG